MTYEDALAWLRGERSWTNIIQSNADTNGPWIVQTAQADAATTQQAYWIVKARQEGLSANRPDDADEWRNEAVHSMRD